MNELVVVIQPLLDNDFPIKSEELVILNTKARALSRQLLQLAAELGELQPIVSISESESSSVSHFDIENATSMRIYHLPT